MANVLFTRTSDPNSKPVTDGQLIFDTSGNGKMYLDNGTDRLEMGGALTVDATLSKTSTNPVQNKAVAGVMLDTLSDIGNVTSKGFLTDALAVKELNTNVNELNNSFVSNIYVGDDGKLHKVQGGADSVLPFSSLYTPQSATATAPSLTLNHNANFFVLVSSTRHSFVSKNVEWFKLYINDTEISSYHIDSMGWQVWGSDNGSPATWVFTYELKKGDVMRISNPVYTGNSYSILA